MIACGLIVALWKQQTYRGLIGDLLMSVTVMIMLRNICDKRMQRVKLHFTGREELWACCVELTVLLEVEFIEVQASKIFPFVCHEGIGGNGDNAPYFLNFCNFISFHFI